MLFNKKSEGRKGASKMVAAELIAHHSGAKAIVLGLQWRSVATAGGRDTAAKIARSARATHFIFRGQQIGFGLIPGKSKDLPQQLYPAAILAAKQHAGDALYVLRIDSGAYWLALIRNGAPTSMDRFVEGIDDAGALALAREVFEPLQSDGIKVSVFTNIERSGIDDARLASSEELLDLAMMDEDQLQQVPSASVKVPKPVLGVIALTIVFLLGQRGFSMWQDMQRARMAAENAVVEEDPTIAWGRSIDNWRQGVSGHGSAGLALARDSMADLPARWDGWTLRRSSCAQTAGPVVQAVPEAAPVTAASVTWVCSAEYDRGDKGILTREIAALVPERWKVSFTPLNQMQLTWQVQAPRIEMVMNEVPTKAYHHIETVSKLQKLAPTLSQAPDFSFAALDIPAPVSSSGVAFPPDERVAGFASAAIAVKGPLRSIDALINAGIEASWTSLSLAYVPTSGEASINSSVITAEAVGVMYAKN